MHKSTGQNCHLYKVTLFSTSFLFRCVLMFLQVDKLILIDASVYAEGTGALSRLPKFVAHAGVSMSICDTLSLLYNSPFCFS